MALEKGLLSAKGKNQSGLLSGLGKGVYSNNFKQRLSSQFGVIFDDIFSPRVTIGSDYIVTNVTATLDGSKMLVTTAGAYVSPTNRRIERNYWHAFQTWEQSLTFTLKEVPGATSYGVGMGQKIETSLFNAWEMVVVYQTFTGGPLTNKLVIYINDGAGTFVAISQSSGTLAAVNGRSYSMRVVKSIQTQGARYFGSIIDNSTFASIDVTWDEDISITSTTPGVLYAHKTARPLLAHLGMDFDVYRWTFRTDALQGIYNLLVGDSITWGLCANNYASRWASRIVTNYSVSTGPSDTSLDVQNKLPNLVSYRAGRIFLFFGFNDIAAGVALATLETRYANIVTTLRATGAQIIHICTLRSTGNYGTFNAWIASTYPDDIVINAVVGMTFSADNVHPDQAGHDFLVNKILSSI